MSQNCPWLPALVAAALSVAACGPRSEPGATAPAAEASSPSAAPAAPADAAAPDAAGLDERLVAHAWQLESATDAQGRSIAALFPAPDHRLGLAFRDGRVGVEGGCNRQSFPYTWLDAGRLKLEPGISTQMACPPPLDTVDAAIAGVLTGMLRASIAGEPDAPTLRLSTESGRVLQLSGTPTPETRFGGPATVEFFEVLPELGPCEDSSASERRCLIVRERFFDEQGLHTGTPGEFRPLLQEIEGYTPTAGQQQVVRVRRYGPPAGTGDAAATHFILDFVVESRTVGS
jgi:heat shock protein HslJ